MKSKAALAVLAASLAMPALASAHVTLQPYVAPADAYARLNVRVPNESDKASTQSVEVQMPDGFAGVLYEPVPGWTVDVKTSKLEEPIQTDDGEITEEVDTVTWTADSSDAEITPGQFQDFPVSVHLPNSPGETLTFPAIQTYSDGEVVRWIGAADAEEPAPTVALTETEDDAHAGMSGGSDQAGSTALATEDHTGHFLLIVALIAGALALVLSLVALLRRR